MECNCVLLDSHFTFLIIPLSFLGSVMSERQNTGQDYTIPQIESCYINVNAVAGLTIVIATLQIVH